MLPPHPRCYWGLNETNRAYEDPFLAGGGGSAAGLGFTTGSVAGSVALPSAALQADLNGRLLSLSARHRGARLTARRGPRPDLRAHLDVHFPHWQQGQQQQQQAQAPLQALAQLSGAAAGAMVLEGGLLGGVSLGVGGAEGPVGVV